MNCRSIQFSRHANEQMFSRQIPPAAVIDIIKIGETIRAYPDDKPYPSALVLGFSDNQPIHVVVARDEHSHGCYVVTAYRPDPDCWSGDYKKRRQP